MLDSASASPALGFTWNRVLEASGSGSIHWHLRFDQLTACYFSASFLKSVGAATSRTDTRL
jgi:hypothetical protein